MPKKICPFANVGQDAFSLSALESAEQKLSDDELEIHIEDAGHSYLIAYERFQLHGCPQDRSDAMALLRVRDDAIRNRPAHVVAARHAAFERELEERCAYFMSDSAQALGREVRAA